MLKTLKMGQVMRIGGVVVGVPESKQSGRGLPLPGGNGGTLPRTGSWKHRILVVGRVMRTAVFDEALYRRRGHVVLISCLVSARGWLECRSRTPSGARHVD